MKKLIYSTAIALSLLGGSLMTISCDDILDTRSESTMYDPQIFSKYELAYGAITGIYHSFGERTLIADVYCLGMVSTLISNGITVPTATMKKVR